MMLIVDAGARFRGTPKRRPRERSAVNPRALVALFALCAAAPGCQQASVVAESDPGCTDSEARPANSCEDFKQALAACRFLHTGSGSQRVQLPPTEDHVAACLRKRGWLPSGTPIIK